MAEQKSSGMPLGLRLLLGGGVAVGGAALVAAAGMFLMMMTAFAFDSPNREVSSDIVVGFEMTGLGTIAFGLFVAGGAVIATGTARKVLTFIAGILVAIGGVSTLIGLGLAFLAP